MASKMDLLGPWDRVRRNLVGTFFIRANAQVVEREVKEPEDILVERQTYSVSSTELEREYRELYELDSLLEKERKDYADQQKQFELRWQQCSEKNDFLNTFLAKFDNYHEVSKLKQESITKVNEKNDNDLADKTSEVNRLKKELKQLAACKVELEQRLKVCKGFGDFMNDVVKESKGEYENVSQVIARYYDLKSIRETFVERTVKQIDTAYELEKELKEITQHKEAENIASKTYLSDLENYKKEVQIFNWRQYDNLLAIKAGLRRELLKSHIPKFAVYNLYVLLCNQMKQPITLSEYQYREQLRFIQKFLRELVKICDRSKALLDCPSDVPLAVSKQSTPNPPNPIE